MHNSTIQRAVEPAHCRNVIAILVLVALLLSLPAPGRGAENEGEEKSLPRWELGLGATWLSTPDYIGSDERTAVPLYPLPFPHIRYRGEWLDVDREAIHGKLLSLERIYLEVSASAAFAVDSDENDARRGMPDLDWRAEIGPKLLVELWDGPRRGDRVDLEVPVRSVIATDFSSIEQVGWTFSPGLLYGTSVWDANVFLGAGIELADGGYHDYIYGVNPEFQTATRPVHSGDEGYGGARFSFGLAGREGPIWYGAFFRYFNIAGAAYADSPLVKTRHAFYGGFAVAWVFWESDTVPWASPEPMPAPVP